MPTGFGAKGTESRCQGIWMDFSKCMKDAEDPRKCDMLKEDYLECLHHNKEKTRHNMIEVEKNNRVKEMKKQAKLEAKQAKKNQN